MKPNSIRILALLLALMLLCAACGGESITASDVENAFINEMSIAGEIDIEDEAVALTDAPALPLSMMPVASGTAVKKNNEAAIDYSNVSDGYVMVIYTGSTSSKLKTQVAGPSGTTYTYNITPGVYATFPLSDGSGSYKVTVYRNTSGTKYATVTSVSFTASLTDEFAPFLMPNQYVNYDGSSQVVEKAVELTAGQSTVLDKVGAVYDYVVTNFTYDYAKAASVQSGYLPEVDTILATKTGICFDYAAVMAAMLRSQGIPTKLVVGYTGSQYHAWINVYSDDSGWINGAVFFDGTTWKLMDPTFASTAKQSASIMAYIENANNYSAKYLY